MLNDLEKYLATLHRELDGMVPPKRVTSTLEETKEHLECLISEGLTAEQAIAKFGDARRLARQLSRTYRPHTPFWKATLVALGVVLSIELGAGVSQLLGFPQIFGYQLIEIVLYAAILGFGIWCYRSKRIHLGAIATVAALYGLSFYGLNANRVPIASDNAGHYLLDVPTIRKTAALSRSQIPVLQKAKAALDAGGAVLAAAKPHADLGEYGRDGEYRTPQYFYDQASKAMWGLPVMMEEEATNLIPFVISRQSVGPIHVYSPTVDTLEEAKRSWTWGPGAASLVDGSLRVNRSFVLQAKRLESAGYPYDFYGQSDIAFRFGFGMFFWLLVINAGAVLLTKIEIRKRRPWPTTIEAATN